MPNPNHDRLGRFASAPQLKSLRGKEAFEAAKKLLSARYPKLWRSIQQVRYDSDASWSGLVTDFVHASFNPQSRALSVTSVPGRFGVSDYVHALAHEMAHAAQTRKPNNVHWFLQSYNRYPYRDNPYEKSARKTGDRVRSEFLKASGQDHNICGHSVRRRLGGV